MCMLLSPDQPYSSIQIKNMLHTCRMGSPSTWYIADCLRFRPNVANGVKDLYLRAVEFTVGVIRPCSITTTAENVHFVSDASRWVKVSPSCWLTTLIKTQSQPTKVMLSLRRSISDHTSKHATMFPQTVHHRMNSKHFHYMCHHLVLRH